MHSEKAQEIRQSPKYVGETDITAEESYLLTGGMSRLGRGSWIVSLGYLGWSLFSPTVVPVFQFLKSAIAFFTTPHIWLQPIKIWPQLPALPGISLVLIACAIVLAMISVAGVCIIRPILKFALLKRRHEEVADHIGLAGRATFELGDEGVVLWNRSRAGERRLRFSWSAFDSATDVGDFIRLSYRGKPLVHIALRAFGAEGENVRAFIKSAVNHTTAPAASTGVKLRLVR